MSAVFEIEIICKRKVSISKILEDMKCAKITYEIDTAEVIDNWEWENQQSIEDKKEETIEELIAKGKIVMLGGRIAGKHKFGMNFSKVRENGFQIGVWISTKYLPQLDCNFVNNENEEIYDYLIGKLVGNMEKDQLIACCMGAEIAVEEEKNVEELIESSHNVCVWILPRGSLISGMDDYEKKVAGAYQIYQRIFQTSQ